jgi:hypothetical protein
VQAAPALDSRREGRIGQIDAALLSVLDKAGPPDLCVRAASPGSGGAGGILEDVPAMALHIQGPCVFQDIDVESLAPVLEGLEGYTLLAGPRETWYGAKEVFLQDLAGYLLAFRERKR